MNKVIKRIAFVAIMALTVVSCQKENLDEQAINAEAQEQFVLPEELYFTPVTQLPEGATLTARGSATNVIVDKVVGDYAGKLNKVVMNGKPKKQVENVTIHITKGANGTFDFELPEFRVGRMPGRLKVDIDGLTLKSNGTFYADEQHNSDILNGAVTLVTDSFGDRNFNATLMEGHFTPVVGGGYELDFTLKCEKSIWKLKLFTAEVGYHGEK